MELQDIATEATVLGTLMNERTAFGEVKSLLSEDCFTRDSHKVIYKAIVDISEKGDRADLIAVMGKVGNKVDMVELSEIFTTHTPDVYQHSAYLHDLNIKRQLCNIGYNLYTNIQNGEDIADVQREAMDRLSNIFQSADNQIFTIDDALQGVKQTVISNLNGGVITGTPTGFSYLDKKMGGLQKSDLIIIAAESSQGKTSLAVTLMNNAVKSGSKVAMYSMEMKMTQIASRMISIESGLPANQILFSRLDTHQLQQLDFGVSQLSGLGVFFDDKSTSNIDNILNSIRSLKAKYDIDGVVVDYLQILNVNMKGSNKEQQMGDVARRLKNIAKELDIWIIALSQLNRDRENPVPTMARLRDSGQIAEAADIVLLIYRPEYYGRQYSDEFSGIDTNGTALIDIAKGRNIGIGKFICGFEKETTKFYDREVTQIDYSQEIPF